MFQNGIEHRLNLFQLLLGTVRQLSEKGVTCPGDRMSLGTGQAPDPSCPAVAPSLEEELVGVDRRHLARAAHVRGLQKQ